jgi:hypothetical protein
MAMFTLVLDLAVHNVFALYLWICEVENATEQEMSYGEFKRRIAVALLGPYLAGLENCQKSKQFLMVFCLSTAE